MQEEDQEYDAQEEDLGEEEATQPTALAALPRPRKHYTLLQVRGLLTGSCLLAFNRTMHGPATRAQPGSVQLNVGMSLGLSICVASERVLCVIRKLMRAAGGQACCQGGHSHAAAPMLLLITHISSEVSTADALLPVHPCRMKARVRR